MEDFSTIYEVVTQLGATGALGLVGWWFVTKMNTKLDKILEKLNEK